MSDPAALSERERIDQALVDLCMEHTYAKLTLPMLLERAGVDRAAFERHYEDLEDCFCRVYAEMRDEYLVPVARAFAEGETWRDRVRGAAYVTLDFLREDLPRARMSFIEILYAGDRAKLIRDEAMQALFALIDQGREEPGAPEALSGYTAEALGSAIYQQIGIAIENDELDDFEGRMRELLYILVLTYKGEEAAREELTSPLPERPPRGARNRLQRCP